MTPIKHGLFSKYSKGTLAEKLEELAKDPRLCDVGNQVVLVCALTADYLEKIEEKNEEIDAETTTILAELAERAGRLIEKKHRIEHGEQHTITVKGLGVVINQITITLEKTCGKC